ncbi:hypothetical protein NL676_003828 [Syzygium grande]|nr:hypothetical protein NL676_003828 [Syzygium grande]
MEESSGPEDVGEDGSSEGRRNLWVGQVRHLFEQVVGVVEGRLEQELGSIWQNEGKESFGRTSVGIVRWEVRARVRVNLAERRQRVGT